MNEGAHEGHKVALTLAQVPAQPTDLVVLAISVVVAELGAAEFVSPANHRHALGQQKSGHEIALLALAQRQSLRQLSRPLDAAIKAQIIVRAVGVALAVGLVALALVGREVLERETVVASNEIDAGIRPAACSFVEVAR